MINIIYCNVIQFLFLFFIDSYIYVYYTELHSKLFYRMYLKEEKIKKSKLSEFFLNIYLLKLY